MEFFNDIKGTLPYMDFSDSETISFDNPNGLPIGKNAIFKVKVDENNSGTIYCFDKEFYRINGEVIEKWKNNSWKEFYDSEAKNALKIYKYISEDGEDANYGYVNFNGYTSYSVGDEKNPIGYADHANKTSISGNWYTVGPDKGENYNSGRIEQNNMQLLKINYRSFFSFISLIDYIELDINEEKYTYLQTIRYEDKTTGTIISMPFYAKQIGLGGGIVNKVEVIWGEFLSDGSFREGGYWDDFQYKNIK